MAFHYKKDGSLDMRYNSSRAAMSSGFGGSSFGNFGGASHSPMSFGPTSFSSLHHKKDGSLDMRYNSSRAAASFGQSNHASRPPSSSISHYKKDGSLDMRYNSSKLAAPSILPNHANRPPSSSELHYKKDGSLDMRYNSSRLATASSSSIHLNHGNRPPSSSEPHYKKDGTLDMRFNSSKLTASTAQSSHEKRPPSSSELHYKKDGTLDMRYASSKNAMNRYTSDSRYSNHGIPKNIPTTKTGIPDMRTNAAKEWVKNQAQNGTDDIPFWIPKLKDGSPDTSKAVTQEYLKWKDTSSNNYDPDQRLAYYFQKLEDMLFRNLVENAREDDVQMPRYEMLPETEEIQQQICSRPMGNANRQDDYENSQYEMPSEMQRSYGQSSSRQMRSSHKYNDDYDIRNEISESIRVIDYKDLNINLDDKLGQGSFGIVYKGTWNYQTVAVKQLYLNKLSRQEKNSFVKEIKIMSALGKHPNLVYLHGYTLEPLCLVMEFIELGSLSHLLHYCEDPQIEAKITDGRIKKKLILGIVLGMIQLHTVGVVHGDLKPQNILVSKDYTAKVTDFGLATLRGKTSSSIASSVLTDDGQVVCGTAGYMAPELLHRSTPPDYSSDVYSFGIMLNEIMQEEEPYSDQFQNFLGRGPFGAANYANQGNRPRISSNTPDFLRNFIEQCWNRDYQQRPTFKQIFKILEPSYIKFPNSFEL